MEYKNINYITKFKLLFIFVLSWIELYLNCWFKPWKKRYTCLKIKKCRCRSALTRLLFCYLNRFVGSLTQPRVRHSRLINKTHVEPLVNTHTYFAKSWNTSAANCRRSLPIRNSFVLSTKKPVKNLWETKM